MKLWPASYPKKCTHNDVRFFMLLCHGAEPDYSTDVDIHVGAVCFGFCRQLLGSGIFSRSMLVPLSLNKKPAHTRWNEDQSKIFQKGMKRHFGIKAALPTSWLGALNVATGSIRFLKAFDAADTPFSGGWLQSKIQEAAKTPASNIICDFRVPVPGTVSGYAYDRDDPEKSLHLDFFVNDTFVGTTQTGGVSRELQEKTGNDGENEFSHTIRLPRHLSARDDLYLSVYDHDSETMVGPATELHFPDIRHTSPLQYVSKQLEQIASDTTNESNQLANIQNMLPAIEQYAAFPRKNYDLYKRLYHRLPPPAVEGILPSISIARAPAYQYDTKADIVVFLGQKDSLLEGAIEWIGHAALTQTDAYMWFGDYEVRTTDGGVSPHYRPPFDLDMFLENPFSACAYAVRRTFLEEVGGLDNDCPAPHVQNWLRLIARHGHDGIRKLPHMAWQVWQTPQEIASPIEILNEHFNLTENEAKAAPHNDRYGGALPGAAQINWPINEELPKLAIIIPTRNAHELIEGCVNSLRNTLSHPDATEIIIVDNGSTDPDTKDWLHAADAMDGIRVLLHDAPFNWAEINNMAVAESDADYFLFLNNDTVALDVGWDHILRGYLNRDDVGLVGARLLFEDGTIQFGGYIVNPDNIALKEAYGESPDTGGYMNRSKLTHISSALIGAFMACRRSVFKKAGGFDAERFPVAFNDIDFSLTVQKVGYKNLYVPAITFHHLESKTRGYDAQDEIKNEREQKERAIMREKWGSVLDNDPYYPSVFLKVEPTHSLLAAPKKASITT